MDKYSNTILSSKHTLSEICISKGLTSYGAVYDFVKQLPYGRTSDRSDFKLVLTEEKGTCSTKHALLKAIAEENNIDAIKLCLGIFQMNAGNTPKIESVLKANGLDYIPEAHCYLKLDNNIVDITFPKSNELVFIKSLLHEEIITPEQIGRYKVDVHQAFLKSWISAEHLAFNFDEIWAIRETCIRHISA